MTLIMPIDPLTATDPFGYPVTYPPPNDYWGLGGMLGAASGNRWPQSWNTPPTTTSPETPAPVMAGAIRDMALGASRTEAPQPLAAAVKNAAASGALQGAGYAMQGQAALNTTLPVIGPLYDEMLRYPQMTREERLQLHGKIVGAPLSLPRKSQVHSALVDSGRGKPLPLLEEFGAYDPEQSSLMAGGRALNDWADQAFPVTGANQQRLPVQVTRGLFGAAPVALSAFLGPVGPFAAGAYLGSMAAGAEAEHVKAIGVNPEQQADAVNRAALLGAVGGALPIGLLSQPARTAAPSLFSSAVNWLSPYARAGAASAAMGEPFRYLSSEISRTYDPDAAYTFDPDRSLTDWILGAIVPFAQGRLPGLTPLQDWRRLTYNTGQRILETIAPDRPLLKLPERSEWVPTSTNIAGLNDEMRSAGARGGVPIEGHHQAAWEFYPDYWSPSGINPNHTVLYMPTDLHRLK